MRIIKGGKGNIIPRCPALQRWLERTGTERERLEGGQTSLFVAGRGSYTDAFPIETYVNHSNARRSRNPLTEQQLLFPSRATYSSHVEDFTYNKPANSFPRMSRRVSYIGKAFPPPSVPTSK